MAGADVGDLAGVRGGGRGASNFGRGNSGWVDAGDEIVKKETKGEGNASGCDGQLVLASGEELDRLSQRMRQRSAAARTG